MIAGKTNKTVSDIFNTNKNTLKISEIEKTENSLREMIAESRNEGGEGKQESNYVKSSLSKKLIKMIDIEAPHMPSPHCLETGNAVLVEKELDQSFMKH